MKSKEILGEIIKNKVYNESCINTMERMPDNYIDLVITSPPYDGLRKYKGYTFPFQEIAEHLYKVIKIGGVLVWVVNDETTKGSETGTSFKQALAFMHIGFRLHDTMIYAKKHQVPLTHNRYEQMFEYMFILSKGKPKTFNPIKVQCKTTGHVVKGRGAIEKTRIKDGESKIRILRKTTKTYPTKIRSNIWAYNPVSKTKHTHPASFPEQLASDHVRSWSNEGDLVYDPCMGSGTVADVCISLKRDFIGSEISQEYYEMIQKRLYFKK